ncbi:MAG: bile acid:sodium symporter family protein [Propionibacteriales bacterium]|nr:bile acid:sodium symporter family protein [Propionibacteriales bacterium]
MDDDKPGTLKRISSLAGTWLPLIVIIAGVIAMITPATFAGWSGAVPWLLSVIMLGMGMTLRGSDFAVVLRKPWAMGVGVLAQYVIMPCLALLISVVLRLDPVLATGMILVGAAPGGTSSNVMTFLAKGDTALSVAMTTVSTLLAPILTPLLVLLLAGRYLPVNPAGLFVSIVQVVLVPIVLGVLLRRFLPRLVDRIVDAMPLVSVLGITGVVMAVVAGSASKILTVGPLVVLAVVVHNVAGLALGYGAAKLTRLDVPSRRTVSIEVGLQNSGLAATLATVHFNPVAALPSAIFSVWHNISGSLLAGYWSRRPVPSALPTDETVPSPTR